MPKTYLKKPIRLKAIRVYRFSVSGKHLLKSIRLLKESRLPYFIKEISRHSGLLVVVPVNAFCRKTQLRLAALTTALPKASP